jgi:membrane-associated protein
MPADLAQLAGWAYLLMALAVIADAVFPLVPAETVAVGGGVLAASGALNLAALLGVVAVGAAAGDALSYQLGRRVSRFGMGRLLRHRRGRKAVVWTTRQLQRRTVPVLVGGRFVPGGRTVTTMTAGFLHVPARRIMPAIALGAVCWASYVTGLGYLGGRAAGESVWVAVLVDVELAAGLTVAIELLRRMVAGRLLAGQEPR